MSTLTRVIVAPLVATAIRTNASAITSVTKIEVLRLEVPAKRSPRKFIISSRIKVTPISISNSSANMVALVPMETHLFSNNSHSTRKRTRVVLSR